jgi:hypothetical protein
MIVYFANRQMEIMGHATTNLRKGFAIVDDLKTEEIETGVAIFECTIGFTKENRLKLEEMTDAGNSVEDILPIMKPMTDFKIRAYQTKVRDMPLEKLEGALELCIEADLAQKQSMSGYLAIEKLICSL